MEFAGQDRSQAGRREVIMSTGPGSTADGALWGGRFGSGPSWAMGILSKSTHFDWQLAPFDFAATRAHAKALHTAGYLDAAARDTILAALGQMEEAFTGLWSGC